MVQELTTRLVGPVRVLDHEEETALGCGLPQQRNDCFEEAKLPLPRVERRLGGAGGGELRKHLRERATQRAELAGKLRPIPGSEVVPDRLDEREIRQREL